MSLHICGHERGVCMETAKSEAWPSWPESWGLSGILCTGPVEPSRLNESFVEYDGELGLCFEPLARRHFPLSGGLSQDKKQELPVARSRGNLSLRAFRISLAAFSAAVGRPSELAALINRSTSRRGNRKINEPGLRRVRSRGIGGRALFHPSGSTETPRASSAWRTSDSSSRRLHVVLPR